VNAQHFQRLVAYLENGKVSHGGSHDATERFIAPTVLTGVAPDAPVMHDEIFGPILRVLEFESLEEALALLRDRPTRWRCISSRVTGPWSGVC
jgi:aldehyde dehydrogenase (NAD+)